MTRGYDDGEVIRWMRSRVGRRKKLTGGQLWIPVVPIVGAVGGDGNLGVGPNLIVEGRHAVDARLIQARQVGSHDDTVHLIIETQGLRPAGAQFARCNHGLSIDVFPEESFGATHAERSGGAPGILGADKHLH